SCTDATGKLKWSRKQLADECRITTRSLESHLPLLSRLELLKPSDDGFRVTSWLTSEKFSKFYEKFSENTEKFSGPPQSPPIRKEVVEIGVGGNKHEIT